MTYMLIAQGSDGGGVNLGDSFRLAGGKPVSEVFGTPGDILNVIIPNLFVLAGVALMILIIVAGYQYIALGEKGIEQAKKIATAALIGMIVMFGAYWVVQIIQSVTGADIPL